MFHFLRTFFLVFAVVTVFFFPTDIQGEEKKSKTKRKSSKITAEGKIHFYGDRYILKENEKEPGKWYILLESPILEEIINKLDPSQNYKVKGKIYKFNRNNYLMAEKITLVTEKKTKAKKKSKKKKKSKRKTKKNKSKKKSKSKKKDKGL